MTKHVSKSKDPDQLLHEYTLEMEALFKEHGAIIKKYEKKLLLKRTQRALKK